MKFMTMGAAKTLQALSLQEYLEIEEKAEFKSEYHQGFLVAMAGSTRNHALIAMNMGAELRHRLRGNGCSTYGSDLKVFIEPLDKSLYPDVTVICGPPAYGLDRKDLIVNPSLVVEVLSGSTEGYDRGEKFSFYRQLPSLQEYVLVSQQRPLVEVFRRAENANEWLLSWAEGLGSSIELAGTSLPLTEVYQGVEWE